jgi:hypothetical protein
MNRNDDIERVLEHWLADGPVHMSDRLFNGTFERIDALPKRRLPSLGLRLPTMNLNLRVAAATAAVVVGLAGVALVGWSHFPNVGAAPTRSPAPSATMLPSAVMQSLNARWDSVGTRPAPGAQYGAPTEFEMTPGLAIVNGFKGSVASTVKAQSDGTLLFVVTEPQASLTNKHWTCATGDQGRYGVHLSDDRSTLTLTARDDACASRAAILPGDWTRSTCDLTAQGCITQLSPGRHDAIGFRPFGGSGSASYAVPAGWAVTYLPPTWQNDTASSIFDLRRQSDGSSPISIWSNVVPTAWRPIANSSPPSCEDAAVGVAKTPQAVATWLATVPGVVASAPEPITIGGLAGVMVDLSLSPGWTMHCGSYSTEGDPPSSPLYDSEPVVIFSLAAGSTVTLDPGAQTRAIMLDANGQILLVVISDQSSAWDATLAETMPIASGLEFTR